MSGVVTAAAAVAAIASTGYAVYSGQQQMQAQKKALSQQQAAQAAAAEQAQSQQRRSEMAINAANQKQPDMSAIQKAAASGGVAGTMLTGPSGVDPAALSLGKSTLLGQ